MPLFKAAEQKPDIDEERLYVGKLPYNISKRELIEMFSLYGLIRLIEIKHGGYAFVEFEDPKNAWGALVLNNTVIDGRKITVEFSNKKQANACFLCSDSGHWARDCPMNKDTSDVKSGKCFKCGMHGHLARYCKISHTHTFDDSVPLESPRSYTDPEIWKLFDSNHILSDNPEYHRNDRNMADCNGDFGYVGYGRNFDIKHNSLFDRNGFFVEYER